MARRNQLYRRNEQDHDQALSMLSSVYGNELLQSPCKIQEFISLIHEEAVEKKSYNFKQVVMAAV